MKGVPAMDIYTILSSKPHNPHYLNRYIKFIRYCQSKNIGYEGYVENHHICPKSLFPKYKNFNENIWNKILLTARQHFIAHIILSEVYNTPEMKQALWFMSNGKWKKFNKFSIIYDNLRNDKSLREFRSENGKKLGKLTKGKTVVKNSDGEVKRLSVDDPKIKSGEYFGIMKYKTTAKDNAGNTLSVSVDDPNLIKKNIMELQKVM